MKKLLVIVGVLFFIAGSAGTAHALSNVALGADVTLDGTFFTDGWGSGSPASQALIDSIVDGVFLPDNTQWDQGTLWWDEHNRPQATVYIDLGHTASISSFIVQADNNDAYEISYYNQAVLEWIVVGTYGPWGMWTRPEIFLPDTIITSQLAIRADSGDGYYSLSEIQAFGEVVPEPSTMLLLGSGLLGLFALKRKRR